MAQRRMISPKVVDTDAFLEMPISARCLYYDFNIRADDDGFVSSPKKIIEMVGASEDDFNLLVVKKFIISFESKVCVIRHWLIHNLIRKDRYNPTIYQKEKNDLILNNKVYELSSELTGIPDGNHLEHQDRLGKYSSNNSNSKEVESDSNGKTIYEIIETEFGRTISPMEKEMIDTWDYPLNILKMAIKEAVTSNNYAIKYIDKIIYNWKKMKLSTEKQIEEQLRRFKERKNRNNQPTSELGTDYQVLE